METRSSDFPSESCFSHSPGLEGVALESWRHLKHLAYQVMTLFRGLPWDFGSSAMDIETSSAETPIHPIPPLYSSPSLNYCGISVSKPPAAGRLLVDLEAVLLPNAN